MLDVLLSFLCVVPAWLSVLAAGAWMARRDARLAVLLLGTGLVGFVSVLAELLIIASVTIDYHGSNVWGPHKYLASGLLWVPLILQLITFGVLGLGSAWEQR